MKKVYCLFILVTMLCFNTQLTVAQSQENYFSTKNTIEGLSIYPNPVARENAIIYIVSKHSLIKQIELFDVLGKQVFATILSGNELNISKFKKGVYILRITENNITESIKLVIK